MRAFALTVVALALGASASCSSPESESYLGYVEGEYVRVAAPIAGELAVLHVQRGQQVTAGTPLFELERSLEQAQLAEAQARLAAAQARADDLGKGARSEERAVIEAQLADARSQNQLAQATLRRVEGLRAQGLTSVESLDQARAEAQRAAARVGETQARLAAAGLAARTDAQRGAVADMDAAQAAVAQAQWQVDHKAAGATAAALVEDTYFLPGEFVPAGRPVVSLLPPDRRRLRFFVPEPRVARLRLGQAVRAHCDGCAGDIAATISYIAPQAEFTPPVIFSRSRRQSLVFMVEAVPAAADAPRLQPGLPVDVSLAPE